MIAKTAQNEEVERLKAAVHYAQELGIPLIPKGFSEVLRASRVLKPPHRETSDFDFVTHEPSENYQKRGSLDAVDGHSV